MVKLLKNILYALLKGKFIKTISFDVGQPSLDSTVNGIELAGDHLYLIGVSSSDKLKSYLLS